MLRKINLRPLIPRPQPITLTIMMRKTMIILQPILQHQLRPLLTTLPPRRYNPPRWLTPLEIHNQLITLVHDRRLLLQRHFLRILVRVAVQADFVPGVDNHAAFFGEGFEAVAWDEPGGRYGVLFEHLQEAADSYGAGEEATRDVGGGVFAAVGA